MFPPVDATRRHLLAIAAAGAIALTVAPAWAAAPAVDPIYAAIERHKEAEAAHLAAIEELNRHQKIDRSTDCGITEKPCHDESFAFEILVGAAAAALPGLLAKLTYLQELAEREEWMFDEREGTAIRLIESFVVSVAVLTAVQSWSVTANRPPKFPPRLLHLIAWAKTAPPPMRRSGGE
jgi:hypothetical protein